MDEARKVKDISHDEAMAMVFKKDPEYAEYYMTQILLDGEPQEIEVARRKFNITKDKI